MIKDILETSKGQKSLINLFLRGEDIEFWCGYIVDYNDDILILKSYSKYGLDDGIIVEHMDNVGCISFDNDYCRLMKKLIADPSVLDIKYTGALSLNQHPNWQYDILEQQLNKKNTVVMIEINNDIIYYGQVLWADTDHFVLYDIDSHGLHSEKMMLKTDEITEIKINNLEAKRRLVFHNWRKNNSI
jgi:hypothetical protein